MKEGLINRTALSQIVGLDVLFITVALSIPLIAHSVGVELRYLEPLRFVSFLSVFFLKERRNNYILSLLLPWISFAFVGVPVFWKSALMSFELCANVWIIYRLLDMKVSPFFAICLSMLFAKGVYYGMKYILIKSLVLPEMNVIGNIFQQILSVLFLSTLFVLAESLSRIIKQHKE